MMMSLTVVDNQTAVPPPVLTLGSTLLQVFDGEEGIAQPDPRIYQRTLARLGVELRGMSIEWENDS
jgi:hypothetical protein